MDTNSGRNTCASRPAWGDIFKAVSGHCRARELRVLVITSDLKKTPCFVTRKSHMELTFHKQSGHMLTVEAFVPSQKDEQL